MKSKKLISLLCAAALAASSFASLAITASAAETTLWSDNFDSYENVIDHSNVNTLGKVLVDGTSIASNKYESIDGIVLTTDGRADDSSYWKVSEGAGSTGKALETQVSRFSSANRGAAITFDETYAPNSNDLVLAFKAKVSNAAETTFIPSVQLNGETANYIDLTSATDWTNVKVVITASGANVYLGDSTTAAATYSGVKNLKSIKYSGLVVDGGTITSKDDAQKAASHPVGYPIIAIDDVVVYTTDSGNGLASTVPAAQSHQQGETTFEALAPAASAPGKVEKLELNLLGKDDINSVSNNDKGRLAFLGKDAADEYTQLKTVNIGFPQHSENRSDTNWKVAVVNSDPALNVTDKYLQATNATDSTATRGPRMYFKKSGAIYEVAEREAVVAQFAARLHKGDDADKKPAEIVFSGDLNTSGGTQNLLSPLAMITTNASAASATYAVDRGLNTDEKKAAHVVEVPDNEWFLVEIEAYREATKATTAKIKVTTFDANGEVAAEKYILGAADSRDGITDSDGHGVNNLPYITFRSGNSTTYGVSGSKNDIDNIFLYSSSAEEPAVEKHTVSVEQDAQDVQKVVVKSTDEGNDPFDAVLIHASYNNGVVSSVKTYDLADGKNGQVTKAGVTVTLPATDKVYEGDKLFVWDSLKGMVPYGAAADVKGETPVVTYTVTLAAGDGGAFAQDAVTSFTVNAGATLADKTIPEPTKDGYTFAGWVKGSDAAITTAQLKEAVINADATYTATYTQNQTPVTNYTVTLAAGDGAFAQDAVTTFTVAEGGTLANETIPEPTKDGYTFAGWVKGSDAAITTAALKAVVINADATYTATYTQNQTPVTNYTVTLAAGDGAFAQDAVTTFTVAEGGTLAGETIPEPTKDGYTFAGWVKGSDAAITTAALKAVVINADATYTATYTKNDVTVSASNAAVTVTPVEADRKVNVKLTASAAGTAATDAAELAKADFSYAWYTGTDTNATPAATADEFTPTAAGTYTVVATVTKSGFTGSVSALVTVANADDKVVSSSNASVEVTPAAASRKVDTELTAAAAGTAETDAAELTSTDFTYKWYAGTDTSAQAVSELATYTPTAAGIYTVVATANKQGFAGTVSAEVTVTSTIGGTVTYTVGGNAASAAETNTAITGVTTAITGGAPAYTYLWQKLKDEGNEATDADWEAASGTNNEVTYTPTTAGKYRLFVTPANATLYDGSVKGGTVTVTAPAQVYQYTATASAAIDGVENAKVPVFVLY